MPLDEDEKIERKRIALIYLYWYHINYKELPTEEKKKIRDYYDNQLRYKNAFYRDKKQFETYGHPSKWDKLKISRFVIHPEKPAFVRGKDLFSVPFKMYSNQIIQINISKQTDINLITIIDGITHIHEDYKPRILKEIKNLKSVMGKIDNTKQTVRVKLGLEHGIYNLGYLQIIFKLQINTIIRHISISYQPSKMLEVKALNKLETFLRSITGLEKALMNEEGQILKPSNIFPDDFEITEVTLLQIELNKRTNLVKDIREYKHFDYYITVTKLSSREVKE